MPSTQRPTSLMRPALTQKLPPTASFRQVDDFLNRIEDAGIPTAVNTTFWETVSPELSFSLGRQVLNAIRALGLVNSDTNAPTEELRALVVPSQRKEVLAQVLRRRYSKIMERVDIAQTGQQELENAFRVVFRINSNEMLQRAVTFFRYAAHAAGFPLSADLLPDKRPLQFRGSQEAKLDNSHSVSAEGRLNGTYNSSTNGSAPNPMEVHVSSPHPLESYEIVIPAKSTRQSPTVTDVFTYLAEGLRNTLPADGQWSEERKARWHQALQAIGPYIDNMIEVTKPNIGGNTDTKM